MNYSACELFMRLVVNKRTGKVCYLFKMLSSRIRLSFCFWLSLILFCETAAFEMQWVCPYNPTQMFYQMIGQNITSADSSVDSILEFVDNHIDQLKFTKHLEIVFVMGTENSSEATLISFITDAELVAIETNPGSGIFIFVDKDGARNQYPRNIVSELIPQLFIDKRRGVEYYIFPDFNARTDIRKDLTASHLMQRSLQFAAGVKFLFTLSYSTVKKNTTEAAREIGYLTRKSTTLINDIEKYSKAISLVVTNVESDPHYTNSSDFESMDTQEKEKVAHSLRLTRDELRRQLNAPGLPADEKNALNKDIRFLEILFEEHKGYKKIGIFRLANETGLINDMAIFQYEKVEIMSMVRRNTEYIPNSNKDFFYEISNETRDRVPELIQGMKRIISVDVSTIEETIINIYLRIEKELFDLDALFDKMDQAYRKISQIKHDDPRSLVKQIIEAVEALKIEIPVSELNDILKHIEINDFLKTLVEQNGPNSFQMSDGLLKTTKYLEESKIWYNFLLFLHRSLSEYKVQEMVDTYKQHVANIVARCAIGRDEEKNVTDIVLKKLLDLTNIFLDPIVEHMIVNSFKLEKLKIVLHRTMLDYGTKFCSPGRLTVQGYNVKLSDIKEMNCTGDVQFREIFVMNNFFIDEDFEETGKDLQLIIIAPTWEVIGKKKITLNGKKGEQHSPLDAPDGNINHRDGFDGKPGKPGYSAGCFMAIGNKFIKDNKLQVHLTGGNGDIKYSN